MSIIVIDLEARVGACLFERGEIEVVIDLFISGIALFSAGLSRAIGESITRAIFMREYMQWQILSH